MTINGKTSRNYRCGMALIAVLWTVMLLIIIVAVMSKTVRVDSYASYASDDLVRARWALKAGVEKAIGLLNDDRSNSNDNLNDLWSDNDTDCNDIILGDNIVLNIKIIDEASKLNINAISKEQLQYLPYMEDDIVAAILDWRDQNDQIQTGGAEKGYYLNLPYSYIPRNGPFQTIRELLLVKDVSEELFYGEDTNFNGRLDNNERDGDKTPPLDNEDSRLDLGWIEYLTCYTYELNKDGSGNQRININEADENRLVNQLDIPRSQAQWIVQNRNQGFSSIADLINANSPATSSSNKSNRPEPMDIATFKDIADRICVSNDQRLPGRVNVNTASLEVLTVLLGNDRVLAQAIIHYRQNFIDGLDNIGQLLDVPQMTITTFKKIAPYVTVRSQVFTIRCQVRNLVTNAIHRCEAVVDRGEQPVKILYWY